MNDEVKEFTKNLIYDETVEGFICTDKFYKKLKDYITNLQQELKEANESVEWWTNRFKAVEKEDYKTRIDKAIEYIEKEYEDNVIIVDYTDNPITPQDLYAELLDILKGDSND